MPAWRCSRCAIDWPAEPEPTIEPPLSKSYEVCAQCLERCDLIPNQDALDAGTARILKLWCAFDHYYANRPAGDVTSLAA